MDSLIADLDRVVELSNKDHFDHVIVGSGLAGGVLARQLTQAKKKVLLIERCGLKFSTHTLNNSRLHWQMDSTSGPSQDNDIVYNAVKAKVNTTSDSDPYAGGPVYCLGGRSNVWGLFCPRISQTTIKKYFPDSISRYLGNSTVQAYQKAFDLMTNGSQDLANPYPKGNAATATEEGDLETKIKKAIKLFGGDTSLALAPIAAQFDTTGLYHFPQGAYSTIDYLLDRLYSRNAYLTVLLDTEVLSFEGTKSPYSLAIRSGPEKKLGNIRTKSVILCAGTIGTASIALNSGLQNIIPKVGKGLTDHEIWGARIAWDTPTSEKEPMKFQSEIKIGGKQALLNVAVNANTFLSRDVPISTNDTGKDVVNITLEFESPLSDDNEVLNLPTPDPVIRIQRSTADDNLQKKMRSLAKAIRNNLTGIESDDDGPPFGLAGFGIVAHEVGTMRIQAPLPNDKVPGKETYVVNDDLQVQDRPGMYACDLSVFPVSPAANPSLTLVALTMRLAEWLVNGKYPC